MLCFVFIKIFKLIIDHWSEREEKFCLQLQKWEREKKVSVNLKILEFIHDDHKVLSY